MKDSIPVEWSDDEPQERCENCDALATTHDIEGVPLCQACADAELGEDAPRTGQGPEGGDTSTHSDTTPTR